MFYFLMCIFIVFSLPKFLIPQESNQNKQSSAVVCDLLKTFVCPIMWNHV